MIAFLGVTLLQVCILTCAEALRLLGMSKLVTRKIAHVLSGTTAALLPYFMSKEPAIVCGILGAAILGLLVWSRRMRSIGEGIDVGAILFPLGMSIAALFFWGSEFHAYQYAVLILAVPDAIAGYVGTLYGSESSLGKTTIGSTAFFFTAFFIGATFLIAGQYETSNVLMFASISAIVLTLTERVSKGIDNLTLPLVAGAIATLV
jgi:dolichol kinase